MKKTNIIFLLIVPVLVFFACSDDNDNTPEIVNEEEIITTLIATLVPQSGGPTVVLQSRDLDGDGPNPPVVTVSGDLAANTAYAGSVQFLNETVNPPEDITMEVREEAAEHQVFFVPSSGLNLTFDYEDFDSNNNPLGTLFTVQTGTTSSGSLTIVLRHDLQKPNDGSLANAGGETDISVGFNLTIQ